MKTINIHAKTQILKQTIKNILKTLSATVHAGKYDNDATPTSVATP
jgi:hypothetical protein